MYAEYIHCLKIHHSIGMIFAQMLCLYEKIILSKFQINILISEEVAAYFLFWKPATRPELILEALNSNFAFFLKQT